MTAAKHSRRSTQLEHELHAQHQHPIVDVRWLVRAVIACILVAAICAYGAYGLLFYQGQWQIVLHPKHGATQTPASAGMKFEDVRFGANESGVPQLDGWMVPADAGAMHADLTVVYFHGGAGSLADAVPALKLLHDAGANVFAVDYRGYGDAANVSPRQWRMEEDGDAAVRYLTTLRGVPVGSIILYGEGVGGEIAAHAARDFPAVAGVVLENAPASQEATFRADLRTHVLPVGMLLNERFDLAPLVSQLRMPKLFLMRNGDAESRKAYDAASAPRTAAVIEASEDAAAQTRDALDAWLAALPKHG
jgi:pimeloyl-ACP methyl ester carboxylesterase